jgi:hypothetical protein
MRKASSDAEFCAVEEAALDYCLASRTRERCVDEWIEALSNADEPGAASLVRVLGRLAGAKALARVRQAAEDPRAEVREAACWALASWPDAGAARDMLRVARAAGDLSMRADALKSLLKVAGDAATVTPAERKKSWRKD